MCRSGLQSLILLGPTSENISLGAPNNLWKFHACITNLNNNSCTMSRWEIKGDTKTIVGGHGHKPGVQFCFWCRQRWTSGSVLLLKTLHAAVFWKCGTVAFPNVNVKFFDEKLFCYWLASIRHIVANYNINWWRRIFWYSVWNIVNISRWFY